MENEKEYELSFTAEQINVNLGNAENAILHTQQTLTPEQQTQARENIGAGSKPVVIDLDTYGDETTSVSDVIFSLFYSDEGGGRVEDVEVGSLFADLNTDSPIRVKFSFGGNTVIVDGVTIIPGADGQVTQLCFALVVLLPDATFSVSVAIAYTGAVAVRVIQV